MGLRRYITAVLMLLMLTPSMVCFKSICVAEAMAGGAMPCCKDMAAHKSIGITLIQDCLHNDLTQVGTVKMPVPDVAVLFIALAAFTFLLTPFARNGGAMRLARPPPEPYADPFAILLATQRFRN